MEIKHFLADIRYLTLFPKRYNAPQDKDSAYWSGVSRRYGYWQKKIRCSGLRWRILVFDDGRKELAYLRVLSGGIFTGKYPAIYRGILFPRMISTHTFARITDIKLAF